MNNNVLVKDDTTAVYMSHYGIKAVVLTEHAHLEKIDDELSAKPDGAWCDGRGKKYLHKMLRKKLLKEEKYFNKHPNQLKQSSERWNKFCNDCVIFAVLNSHLYDEPVYLIHPQDLPSLMEKVSLLQ